MARSPPKNPLVAIIGATGTGKSELAVELAKLYNGEIINGDAMQLYAGLPIITNKITDEEKQDIPHHLLGCISLEESPWIVGTFVKRALATIGEIRARGRLPIVVGGTHYYTQSLLFHDRLTDAEGDGCESPSRGVLEESEETWPILKESTEVLLQELKKVDPVMANRWHPHDRRKIQRSLAIYLQSGRPASEIYVEQRQRNVSVNHSEVAPEEDSGLDEARMRFPTLLLWTYTEREALRTRLDERVDKMLDRGLIDEARLLEQHLISRSEVGESVDESRGIWVSIGFKEFKSYLEASREPSENETTLQELKAKAAEETKIATRQYAKRQIQWIRNKLVNILADARASDQLYLLGSSDVSAFSDNVVTPAAVLTEQFLQGAAMQKPTTLCVAAVDQLLPKRTSYLANGLGNWPKQYCDPCNVTCVTEPQWILHTKSKRHRKRTSKRKHGFERMQPAAANDMTSESE